MKFVRNKPKSTSSFGFFMFMIGSVGDYIWPAGFLFVLIGLLQVLIPVYLSKLLEWLQQTTVADNDIWKGYYYSGVLTAVIFLRSFLNANASATIHQGCVAIANHMSGMVAYKVSTLPTGARKHINIGKITNLLISDVKTVMACVMSLD